MRSLNAVPSADSCPKKPSSSIDTECPRAAERRLEDIFTGLSPASALTLFRARTTAPSSAVRRSTFAALWGAAVGAMARTATSAVASAARDRMPAHEIGRLRPAFFPRTRVECADRGKSLQAAGYGF